MWDPVLPTRAQSRTKSICCKLKKKSAIWEAMAQEVEKFAFNGPGGGISYWDITKPGVPDSQESEPSPTLAFTDNVMNLSTQPSLESQACDLLLSGKLRQQDLEFKGGLTVIVWSRVSSSKVRGCLGYSLVQLSACLACSRSTSVPQNNTHTSQNTKS